MIKKGKSMNRRIDLELDGLIQEIMENDDLGLSFRQASKQLAKEAKGEKPTEVGF